MSTRKQKETTSRKPQDLQARAPNKLSWASKKLFGDHNQEAGKQRTRRQRSNDGNRWQRKPPALKEWNDQKRKKKEHHATEARAKASNHMEGAMKTQCRTFFRWVMASLMRVDTGVVADLALGGIARVKMSGGCVRRGLPRLGFERGPPTNQSAALTSNMAVHCVSGDHF